MSASSAGSAGASAASSGVSSISSSRSAAGRPAYACTTPATSRRCRPMATVRPARPRVQPSSGRAAPTAPEEPPATGLNLPPPRGSCRGSTAHASCAARAHAPCQPLPAARCDRWRAGSADSSARNASTAPGARASGCKSDGRAASAASTRALPRSAPLCFDSHSSQQRAPPLHTHKTALAAERSTRASGDAGSAAWWWRGRAQSHGWTQAQR